MAIVQGRGPCEIPNEKGFPCGQQINEGEPHGSVVTPLGYRQGHRRCADAFHQRKMTKERQERHEAMVKRVDTNAQGAIDWTTEREGIAGSIPLEKSPNHPPLSEVAMPAGVRPISEVPMDYSLAQAQVMAEGKRPPPDNSGIKFGTFAQPEPETIPDPDYQPQLERIKEGLAHAQGHERLSRPTIPEGGFAPEAFPSVAVAFIPYNSGSAHHPRPDPLMSITDDGWMFIETGNVRVALPDEEEWNKFVAMGTALWNTHNAKE